MAFVGRFGRPWRQPPPRHPKYIFSSNTRTARVDATLPNVTLSTVVEVPRTATLSATIANVTLSTSIDVPRTAALSATIDNVTLSATAGRRTNANLAQTIDPVTLSSVITRGQNAASFSEQEISGAIASNTITGAEASSEVYPRA